MENDTTEKMPTLPTRWDEAKGTIYHTADAVSIVPTLVGAGIIILGLAVIGVTGGLTAAGGGVLAFAFGAVVAGTTFGAVAAGVAGATRRHEADISPSLTQKSRGFGKVLSFAFPLLAGAAVAGDIYNGLEANSARKATNTSHQVETNLATSRVELVCDLTEAQQVKLADSFSQTNTSAVRDARVMESLRRNCAIRNKLVP